MAKSLIFDPTIQHQKARNKNQQRWNRNHPGWIARIGRASNKRARLFRRLILANLIREQESGCVRCRVSPEERRLYIHPAMPIQIVYLKNFGRVLGWARKNRCAAVCRSCLCDFARDRRAGSL